MANKHASKTTLIQQLLQPHNPSQVQMVRRLIEQQHIGMRHHRLGNRQPLPPPAAERRCLRTQVRKPSPPRGLPQPALMLTLRHFGPHQRRLQHSTNRHPRREIRLLLHVSHTCPLPHRNVAGVRVLAPRKYLQQRALPRPIRPDQPNTVPIRNSKRNLTKQSRRAKSLGQPLRI